jgi:hypothetical protein
MFEFLTKNIFMQDQQKDTNAKKLTAKKSETLRASHREWKIARRKRQCKDFSTMLYWESVTSCVAL